jgi:hypothetical protein
MDIALVLILRDWKKLNWTSHRFVQAGTAHSLGGLFIEEYAAVESFELISLMTVSTMAAAFGALHLINE